MIQINIFTKQKADLKISKIKLWIPKGKCVEGGVNRYLGVTYTCYYI